MKARFLLLPLLIILSEGCASNHPTVGAWRSAGFSPAHSDKIALTLRPNPSDDDAEVGRILTAELEREGFNLMPLAEADYTLAYAMEDDSVENYVPARIYTISAPSQNSRDILASGMPAPPGITPQGQEGYQSYTPPTLLVYHTKGIRLYLYTNPKTHPGGLQLAWSGCIDAGEKVSAKREPLLIQALLVHFGQDYAGHVSLPK